MKLQSLSILGLTALFFTLVSADCNRPGCQDPDATNYDPNAQKSGECFYSITTDIENDLTIHENESITICGDIDVTAKLTIKPGATVMMCADATLTIKPTGAINAVGTADAPILIKGEESTKGFWSGLAIYSNNPNNELNHVYLSDGGSYWLYENATLYLAEQARLSMQNTTVSNSQDIAFYVSDGATLSAFSNNAFTQSTTGININASNADMMDENSDYTTDNERSFVLVRSGEITSDATWKNINTPFLTNGLTISAGLTLSEGIEVLVEAQDIIDVTSSGWLKAIGSSGNKIQIKGRYNSSGYWSGLYIRSNNPNNELRHVNLSDGGSYWLYEHSNICINDGGQIKVNDCNISNANNYGIYINSSSSINCGGQIQSTANGVESFNSFSNNGSGADANCTGSCNVFFE